MTGVPSRVRAGARERLLGSCGSTESYGAMGRSPPALAARMCSPTCSMRKSQGLFPLQFQLLTKAVWRTGWDSNPRYAYTYGGFQDRCLKPLGHPSRAPRT